MAFDPTTAKVINLTGFDINSAQPVQTQPKSVFNPANSTIVNTNIDDATKVSYMSDIQTNSVPREKFFGMQKIDDNFIQDYVGRNSNLYQDVSRGVANEVIRTGQAIKRLGTKVGARAIAQRQVNIAGKTRKEVTKEMSAWEQDIARELVELSKTNHKYRQELGIAKTEYDGVAFDLGSVFAQLGMSVVSRSPRTMASIFGITQQQELFEEVFETTGEVGRAELVATGVSIPTAALEYIGLDRLLKAFKGNSIIKNTIKGAVTEGIQEVSQAVVEEIGTQVFGGREKEFKDTLIDIGYSGLLGFIGGGTISGAMSIYNQRMQEEGFSPEASKELSEMLAKKINESPEIQKETVNIIARQNDNTTHYGNNIDNGISEVKKAIEQKRKSLENKTQAQVLIEEARGVNINLDENALLEILGTYEQTQSELNKLRKPKTLLQFIKENGGIYDEQGELASRDIVKQAPFILRKSSVNNQGQDVHPDTVAQRAWEANYFPELTERPTINQLLDRINEELIGNKQVSDENVDDTIRRDELLNTINGIEREVDIDKIKALRSLSPEQREQDALREIAEEEEAEIRIREQRERRINLDKEYSIVKDTYGQKTKINKDKDRLNAIETYIKPLSTVLKDIDPIFTQKIRSADSDQKIRADKYYKQISPFTKAVVKKVKGVDYAEYDLALKNNDTVKLDELNKKYGIEEEYKKVRDMFDDIYNKLKDSGSEFGKRKDYFVTKVKDYPGFLKYITTREDWGKIQQHLKEKGLLKSSLEDQAEAIDNFLKTEVSRPRGVITRKGFIKQRRVQLVTSELNRFYEDSLIALTNYIGNANKLITVNKFFGVNPDLLKDGLGEVVAGMTNNRQLSPGEQQRLTQAFSDFFKSKASSKNIQIFKNINYLTGLTNIGSTLTQIKDIALSLRSAGIIPTLRATGQIITRKQQLTAADLGITKAMEEMEDIQNMVLKRDTTSDKINKRLNKLLRFSLKTNLFPTMDFFGKNVGVQSHLNKYVGQAQKESKSLQNELKGIFEEETANKIFEDLKAENISDDVKHFIFYKVADILPISSAEMPSAYLRHPGTRIFYTFKTYTIKQLDIINNEVVDNIFSTNPKKITEGFTNLTKLLFYYAAIGIPVDMLKDFVFNRTEDKETSDYVFENILQTFGLSRWNIYNFKRNGADIALIQTIAPPIPIVVDLTRDIVGEEYFEDWRTAKNIPIGGKMYYWWFGGGSEF